MTEEMPDNVRPLGVKFRERAPDDRVLVEPHEVPGAPVCNHLFATYTVSEADAEVTCGRCNGKVNPMWVLVQLAREDRRMHATQQAAKRASERHAERSRTKCDHCGRMTRIRGL